jgi:hypothetical protein
MTFQDIRQAHTQVHWSIHDHEGERRRTEGGVSKFLLRRVGLSHLQIPNFGI